MSAVPPEPADTTASYSRTDKPNRKQKPGPTLSALTAIITLIIAVWGAITGTIAWTENRQISIKLSANTFSAFYSVGSAVSTEAIHLSLVNTSTRAISLVQAEVLLHGQLIGMVTSVTPEEFGGLGGASTPLPTSVAANSSSTVGMEWRATTPLSSAVSAPVNQRHLALRIRLDPGGVRLVSVRTGVVSLPIGSWYASVLVRHNRVAALLIETAAASSGSVIATLNVWPADPAQRSPILTATRPAAYGTPGWYSLSSLPTGGYVFNVSTYGRSLVTGVFQSRCVGPDGVYGVAACVYGDTSGIAHVQATPPGVSTPP